MQCELWIVDVVLVASLLCFVKVIVGGEKEEVRTEQLAS